MSETELTFEQAQTELEKIVERLEQGQASLDEALKLWERGEELYKEALASAKDDFQVRGITSAWPSAAAVTSSSPAATGASSPSTRWNPRPSWRRPRTWRA